MNRCDRLSILIVDDQYEVLCIYRQVLGTVLGHHVKIARMPAEALRYVRQQLFDVVLVDAKFPYRGAILGGLLLAEEISNILGINAVILMSQHQVQQEVNQFASEFTFLPKPNAGSSFLDWVRDDLMQVIHELVALQYGFVAMPYGDPECTAWYQTKLVPWMREVGFQVKRMDEIPTTGMLGQEMYTRIRQAHFIICFTSHHNANAFFEAGFAFGLQKNIVVLTPTIEQLPFDLKMHPAIEMEHGDEGVVRTRLLTRIQGLRGLPEGIPESEQK